LKRVRAKIRAPTEQRQSQLTQHYNTLIMEYNRYISDYIKNAEIRLEKYLSCFRYWRQFRQRFYTGHRELYSLIGRNDYRLFIERMEEALLHYKIEISKLQLLLSQLH
jgi:hypothetical protein